MFLIILLRLALLVAFSITCIVLFAILLICVVICVTMAIIRMITVTSVRRGGVMFGSFSFCTPCVNCVSAMSHARSGILLFGTASLPSLVFPVCSSSYSLQTFSVMGIFLTSLRCTLVTWPWLSLISTWFFPKSPTIQKSLYFGWNAFDVWSLMSKELVESFDSAVALWWIDGCEFLFCS